MESKLQIISGNFRGRKLHLPQNARPTQNIARIALFNMLQSGIINMTDKISVWDAFAGSGAFGIECLSRYPNSTVIFTDTDAASIKTVRDNLALLNVGTQATALQMDAIAAIDRFGADADLIFVDPPYADDAIGRAFIARMAHVARPGTIVIWEQDTPNASKPDDIAWETLRDKKYGRARFLIMRRK